LITQKPAPGHLEHRQQNLKPLKFGHFFRLTVEVARLAHGMHIRWHEHGRSHLETTEPAGFELAL